MYGIEGKVVVITGSGRRGGLGAGMATRFAQEGCRLVLCDLGRVEGDLFPAHGVGTSDELEAVAAEVRAIGAEVRTIACDVRDESQVENLMARTIEGFGAIDIVVNNAGIGYLMQKAVDMELSAFEAVLAVNLTGMFLATKHAARHMVARGQGGRIINIASQAAKSGFPFASAYTSSKHGVIGLTRSTAIELAPHGITVNAICPNHVTTGLGAWQNAFFSDVLGQTLDEYMAAMRARIPMGRTGTPEDIARAAAFLASDEAAYITGEAINVSGGEEMH